MKILSFILLFSLSGIFVFADTHTICNLDLRDVWTYNYNASHWIEQSNLQTGKSMYGEEIIPIKNVPEFLRGADWIQTAYGSKNFTNDTIASFELKEDAEVYIIHSSKITHKPAWLSTYTPVEGIVESVQGNFGLYKKPFKKGAVVVLGNNGDTRFPMYIVAITPVNKQVIKLSGENVIDITTLGAVGDGKTINTKSIQQAIDKCSGIKGGGIVYIRDGVFVTGTLELKSNVTLYVEAGAILRGSFEHADYPEKISKLPSFRSKEHYQLLFAEGRENISITGGGIIDGYSIGEGWPFKGKNNEHERPRLIRMISCENVNVNNITLIRSGNWTQYYESCKNMSFENIRVRCYTGTNNQDGIDISGCSNVIVRNLHALCGDDVVCIKALSMTPAKNILVDGVFSRYANCNLIKIGTETHGDISDLTVRNARGNARYGIAIEAVDGSKLNNILYENITLFSCASPVFIRLGNRGRTFEGGPNPSPISEIRNVTIRNVKNLDISYVEQRNGPGVGSAIAGIPGHPLENVKIENCDFLFYGSIRDKEFIYRDIPENEDKYPEFNTFGTCPAYGLYFRHVKGLECVNVTVRVKNLDIRPAIVLEDVADYRFQNVETERFTITEPGTVWVK